MAIETLKNQLPSYAKDLKLNLSGLFTTETSMTPQQLWGVALASAYASRNPKVTAEILDEAKPHLGEDALNAVKAASAIMAMNNVYYRFRHLADAEDYEKMPAKLRMSVIANPGVDKVDFELWSIAVSAINACGACINAHDNVLVEKGVNRETIQTAVRIASVIHAVAVTLEMEENAA